MTVVRECFVLPGLFLTVVLLGGLRVAGGIRFVPPPVMALALAMLLLGCLLRARVLVPDVLMHGRRGPLENVSGLVVLLTLFAACAQVFNLLTPEAGLLHAIFGAFFFVQLLTTLAAVRERALMLRGLAVLFGSAFLLRFVILESLYAPDGGTLQRVLTALLEGVTLGTLGYSPNAAITGYAGFAALVLFLTGILLLAPPEPSLAPGVLGPGALESDSLGRGSLRAESLGPGSSGAGSRSLGPGSSGTVSPDAGPDADPNP